MVYDAASLELLGLDSIEPSNNPAPKGLRVLNGAGIDLAIAGDAYEGSSSFTRELANFHPAMRSADKDIGPGKRLGDVRSRDLSRNDPYLQGGVTTRKDNIVGSYFMLSATPNSKRLFGKVDDIWEDEFQEEVEEKFAADSESFDAHLDASGRNTLTEMVRLAIEQHTLYGEVLASVEWISEVGRPCATAIQMIDTDRLSTPPGSLGDNSISLGVKMNPMGKPIGYHFRMDHPSNYANLDSNKWKYVPSRLKWGRRQMLHLFEQHRPAQSRGIGVMVSAISEMKMSKQFRQIVLQNAILNATYAATIESDSIDSAMVFQMLGGEQATPESVENLLSSYMAGHYNTMGSLMGGSKNLQIDGVKIPHLPPGTKLNLNGAGQGGPLGTDFETSLNRVMAASLGISYEQFSRDYSNTNYSSARAAMSETYKAMLAVKRAVADRFATETYHLWLEEMLAKGEITSVKNNMPSYYVGRNKSYYGGCEWVGASRGQIDELKETQAAILRMNNGLSTLADENARLGNDWRKQLRQMARENDWKGELQVLQGTDDQDMINALSGSKNETEVKE
jgi:lambda family phage portal protein